MVRFRRRAQVYGKNRGDIRELNEENAVVEYAGGGPMAVPVEMLNSVMSYIKQHHFDAAFFIGQDISWTRTGHSALPGRSQNVYSSNGWTVTIGRPIVPEVFYEVRTEYKIQRNRLGRQD